MPFSVTLEYHAHQLIAVYCNSQVLNSMFMPSQLDVILGENVQ